MRITGPFTVGDRVQLTDAKGRHYTMVLAALLLPHLDVEEAHILPRARALARQLEEEPHLNPNTGTMEFSLRDPDGYYVTISALDPPR